jgi:hypothetical protein
MKVWVTRDEKGCGSDKHIFIWREEPFFEDGVWQTDVDGVTERFFSENMLFVLTIGNFKRAFNYLPDYLTVTEDKLILFSEVKK